jgi:hypothetical protein
MDRSKIRTWAAVGRAHVRKARLIRHQRGLGQRAAQGG